MRTGTFTAHRADKAAECLSIVQGLLTKSGMRTLLVKRVGLKLHGNKPHAPGEVKHSPPELIVFGPDGKQAATVTMGRRSGCYVVRLDEEASLRSADQPEQVVSMLESAGLPGTTQDSPDP